MTSQLNQLTMYIIFAIHALVLLCLGGILFLAFEQLTLVTMALITQLIALFLFSFTMILSKDNWYTRFMESSIGEPLAKYGNFIVSLVGKDTH